MNPFTAHLQRQGLTYLEHGHLAMGVACRLLASVAAFALHAVLPFVPIARGLDLDATAAYLRDCSRQIETAKRTVRASAEPDCVGRFEPRSLRGFLLTQQ